MRKLLLTILLCIVLASPTLAGCIANTNTIMYFDPDRFLAVDRVANFNEAQAQRMALGDIEAGRAVLVTMGTTVTKIETLNKFISIFKIGEVNVIGCNEHVNCN